MTIPETTSLMSLAPGPELDRAKDSPEKILNAARQFEALLIAQMLKSTQEEEGLGEQDGVAGSVLGGIGQEQFALALAQRGGIGLAKSIADGLSRHN